MSKRPGSPMVPPVKIVKVEDAWTIAPSQTADVDLRTTEKPDVSRLPFKPVSAGPKTRVQQIYMLSFKPKLEASISLNGSLPEVRFSSSDASICITGDELLQLANCRHALPSSPLYLTNTRLEPLAGGCVRFARYEKLNQVRDDQPAQEQDFFPIAIFDMPAFAVKRLKSKLDAMSTHVFRLLESEPIINVMFECIVRAYKEEYVRLVSLQSITQQFDELSRLVETHVSAAHLVKDFCFHTSGSPLNHYSLLSCALAQKSYIRQLL